MNLQRHLEQALAHNLCSSQLQFLQMLNSCIFVYTSPWHLSMPIRSIFRKIRTKLGILTLCICLVQLERP